MKNMRIGPVLPGAGLAAVLTVIGFVAASGNATAATREEVMKMVSEEASRNGRVPVSLALAVAKVESNFNDRAVSYAGARGVMQVMPSTAMAEFGVPKEQLMDPRLNVRMGIAYLERLHNQYGQDWELALSHYNGGSLPMNGGRFVMHDYTRQYVADVVRWARSYQTDGTAVALTGAGITLAALQGDDGIGSGRRPTRQAEPDWQEIHRATGAPADGDRFLSRMLAEATRDLAGRFRDSLNGRRGSDDGRFAENQGYPMEPVRHEEWPRETYPGQSTAPSPTGRFNYAPFSSARFL